MGNNKLRKLIDRETKYLDNSKIKHKHNFSVKCILEINLINDIRYYNVLKCDRCNSFISIREEGNVQGRIFRELNEQQKKLPLLKCYVNKRNIIVPFSMIEEVKSTNEY